MYVVISRVTTKRRRKIIEEKWGNKIFLMAKKKDKEECRIHRTKRKNIINDSSKTEYA